MWLVLHTQETVAGRSGSGLLCLAADPVLVAVETVGGGWRKKGHLARNIRVRLVATACVRVWQLRQRGSSRWVALVRGLGAYC